MFKNFIKTTFQNISRNKSYVFINTIGLSIGIASLILISLFIFFELSYDRFNENQDEIYRLVINAKLGERAFQSAFTSPPTGNVLVNELDEVLESVRLDHWTDVIIHVDDTSYVEEDFVLADSGFFEVFTIPLIMGNPHKALKKKYSIVLTRATAKKYFGDVNPMGKTLRLNTSPELFTVTGVVEEVPENCHFNFDLLASFSTHRMANNTSWLNNSVHTYILLKKGVDAKGIEQQLPGILKKYFSPELMNVVGKDFTEVFGKENSYKIQLQPLRNIHLNPSIKHGLKESNDEKYIYVFALIAVLIIIVAAINYTNLSVARGAVRAKEIGLRKVSGSSQRLIVLQFVFEAIVLSFIALGIAVFIVEFTIPYFNKIIQLNLSVRYFKKWFIIPGLCLIAILIGVISGAYPAFYLSRFNPVNIFGSKLKPILRGKLFRNFLVIVQYTISIIIISGTIISYNQTSYMLNKDLGFNKEQILIIKRAESIIPNIHNFLDEILTIPGVVATSNSTSIPGFPNSDNGFLIEGKPTDKAYMMFVNWVDPNYKQTYNLQFTSGRFFNEALPSDSNSIVINEATVDRFHLENPLNINFVLPGSAGTEDRYFKVIGVVKNFHFQSLHDQILPHAFMLKPEGWNWGGYFSIRISGKNKDEIISLVEKKWMKYADNQPLQYSFLNEDFESLYKEEKRTGSLSLIFSIVAIILATLGLFGLTSFKIEQRNKEISLRKVVGAEVENIILFLSKDIILLIVISTFIALPITYVVMNKWLSRFYYHIKIDMWDFVLSVLISFVIALLAVGYKTYLAAKELPAEALRCE